MMEDEKRTQLTATLSNVHFRYPATPEEFYASRLPGTWDQDRAGKRMKLPTPETWETQVSLKGNKATTWQDLIGKNGFLGNQFMIPSKYE